MKHTTTTDLANEFGISREDVRVVLRKEYGTLANPHKEWRLDEEQTARTRELLTKIVATKDKGESRGDDGSLPLNDGAKVHEMAVKVFEHIVDGGSVFVDVDVFTDENIEVLFKRFVGAPEVDGDSSFAGKLAIQFDGVADGPILLFAEAVLLQIGPLDQFYLDTKIRYVQEVLDLASESYAIPNYVREALGHGTFGGGQRFSMKRYEHMVFVLELIRFVRALDRNDQQALLRDPVKCAELVRSAPGPYEPSLRNSIIYQLHPDYYQPIVSEKAKTQIVEAFCAELLGREPSESLDSDLHALDQEFLRRTGQRPNFYSEELRLEWDPSFDGYYDSALDEEGEDEYTTAEIVDEGSFFSASFLDQIVEALRHEKNLILEGSPGTGKTWLARRIAAAATGYNDNEHIRSVQFHPGTSYEDFVRGWRPKGTGKLALVDGPILEHAQRAFDDPDNNYVLVIEEINRGNPAQAFGELLTLIEESKRNPDDALDLAYMHDDEEPYYLPENLFIIGTMNIADRSLALVDFALRRRFAFQRLEPMLNDAWRAEVVRHVGPKNDEKVIEIQRRMTDLNDQIADDRMLGPAFRIGHSFVTPTSAVDDIDRWFTNIVNRKLVPQLEEYWIESPSTVASIAETLRTPL